MRDLGLADRLRAAGQRVIEVDGWQSRGSSSFTPRGGVDHHTAGSNKGNAPSLNICTNGRTGLAGPLCNVLQGFDNTCYVIASGRANHAGTGGWRGLSGNSSVYGFERENDGRSPSKPGQHEAASRAWAAILRGGPNGNLDPNLVCEHREWTTRKPDFHDCDGNWMRGRIAEHMQGGHPIQPEPPKPPPDQPLGVPDMFVVISGVSCIGLCNNVMFQFKDWNTFLAAKNASPGVPMMVIPDTESLESRQHHHQQLFLQHVAAVAV